ncbi:unnamed protein product [Mesocestoides corti]|uniref:PPM-type phosphatase domain-containing protein n=1 Tax=Mesocestoides corti TaxID=53468 RepID=A0A158QU32_MESCO|nr:unnamed protein product [Mesocestoides corti]
MGENNGDTFLWKAASPSDLPPDAVMLIVTSRLLDRRVVAAMTGPDNGFQVAREWKDKSTSKTLVCGTHGDPIADAFVIKVRHSSAFLAVADGVNWGEAPMRAARCAINSIYEQLETKLFLGGPESLKIRNTKDAAELLFAAFRQAHVDIVAQTRGLSTLCVGLLLPVHLSERHRLQHARKSDTLVSPQTILESSLDGSGDSNMSKGCSALIVASVGDSQAFLLRDGTDAVELTGWVPVAHSTDVKVADGLRGGCDPEEPPERDFRDTGGALGPVYESGEPELRNLMCAVALCNPGDVVILGTDGLTDNFDPVVVRIAIPRPPDITFADENDASDDNALSSKPVLHFRHNWAKMAPISTPYTLPVWPKPPPPPPHSLSTDRPPVTPSPGGVSARSLNYTEQLELTWPERRQYVAKEITRLWYELEHTGSNEISSKEFAEALLKHVQYVTTEKRQFLEAPETTKLKAQFSRYLRKKNSAREDSASAGVEDATDTDKELRELERRRAWIMDTLRRLPGKLDHATVVVLQVSGG